MKYLYLITVIGVFLFFSICLSTVSAMQVERLTENNIKFHYMVTCDNGMQHRIIANLAKQDFQYYYLNKGYYIKYYDIKFESNIEFAEWVCRNK